MAQKNLTTSYLTKLSNANHDGVTQQIDDRLQSFETDNLMILQAAKGVTRHGRLRTRPTVGSAARTSPRTT